MDTAIVYTAIGFGGLASILAFFLFFSRAKLQDTLADAQEKLTREQSRSAEALIRHAEKQKSPAKPPIDSSKTNKELLELRRANAHLKDEIKQLKQSLREAEQRLKEADERVELSLFKVRAENSALLEKLKDLEQNSPDKKKAFALEQELREWQNRSRELSSELSVTSKDLKHERQQLERSKKHTDALQKELQTLKALMPETDAATTEAIKKFDPRSLERWRDRAYTARHMYKMMRQMRELSDLKLSTYQEAVVDVSSCLLELKGAPQPELAPNELKADRLLAEAWALIQPDLQSDTHSNAE